MKSWYLIQSKPRGENIAKDNLERQGYEVYLPLILGRVKKRGKTSRAIQPMFPRYLFIYLSDETDDWRPIRSTIGVSNLVRFGLTPAKIPKMLINGLKKQENNKGIQELPNTDLDVGDKLLIAEGPFEGYEATLFSHQSQDRIVVMLKIAEKYVKIELNQSVIEKLD